ncbi:MAG: hybrid sensor histidine kinase/response regulator [Methanoregula sp.]|jgi:signal transduction histidine kinase|nr:hybrid sensor histidine kinase/response regulator [Methanoregula sp.]
MISVLLVDDEPDLLEVAKLYLERSGVFSVDTCRSAKSALNALTERRYDAIIADYDMPIMSGLDLLKELKAKGDPTPFIMLTGAGPEDVVIDALNAGAMFFLRKGDNLDTPFSDLTHKVHLAVQRRQSERNLQLFSAISRHDLLNKIAGLQGYAELVRAHTDDSTIIDYMTKQQLILGMIREQIQFIEDYERIGIQKPYWQQVTSVIRKAASLQPAGIINLTLEGIDEIEIFSDPLLLKVFYNLLDNTIRHGNRHITTVKISAMKSGGDLILLYEDDGVGIPAAEKEHIFIRGKGKNTGLGLYLIREILSITGITIQETGFAGKGVRFEITVPDVRYRSILSAGEATPAPEL